jgi:hypothetical protein
MGAQEMVQHEMRIVKQSFKMKNGIMKTGRTQREAIC